MKLRVLLAAMGLLTVSPGFSQPPAPDGSTTDSAPAPAPADDAQTVTKSDAAKSAPDSKKAPPAKKKEEPPPKIEGLTINRPNGGFLGLQVLNNNFVLTFYNEKKKKVAPDVALGTVRWPVKYQPAPERTVLNPDGGFALTSGYGVRPPLQFKVFISLFVEGNDQAVESYVVDYHGE
jgi:hypothetical protein